MKRVYSILVRDPKEPGALGSQYFLFSFVVLYVQLEETLRNVPIPIIERNLVCCA